MLLPRQTPHEREAQSFPRRDIDLRVVVVSARHREGVALGVHCARRVARAAVGDGLVETWWIKNINLIVIMSTQCDEENVY